MKAETSSQQKANPLKKSLKPLNQKKNSISTQNIIQKSSSKPNLTLKDNEEISAAKIEKVGSPKNISANYLVLSPKTQGNQDFFKSQKSVFKKGTNLKKVKKAGISKHQPIKRQTLPIMRSPKNVKDILVQSQIYLASTSSKKNLTNEDCSLNIDLDTSIAKVELYEDENTNQIFESQTTSVNDFDTVTKSNLQFEQLTKTSKEQTQEIARLKQKNQELQTKLVKIKASQQENRKKLRQRISTFNEQAQQTKALKQKITELEKRVFQLEILNNDLKCSSKIQIRQLQIEQIAKDVVKMPSLNAQIYKVVAFQVYPQKFSKTQPHKNSMIDESVMVSLEDSMCDGILSFINGNFSLTGQNSVFSNQKDKCSSNQSCNLIPSLEMQVIKNSYQQKYKEQIIFIQNTYNQNVLDIQNRYKLLLEQARQIVKSQERQISSFQIKMDQLYEKIQQCSCSSGASPNIATDNQKLKLMMTVNKLNLKISQKENQLKHCRQQIRSKEIECKTVVSQLDIERIRFNLNSELVNFKASLIQIVQNQQFDLLKEQLRQERQKNVKIQSQNQKKQDLIKKLTTYQNSTTLNNNKKMRK